MKYFVNMISALIVFVGGMVIVIFYPGQIANKYRILIGAFVSIYFIARVTHTLLVMQREKRRARSVLGHSIDSSEDDQGKAKSA